MGIQTSETDLVREIRLPAGGSYILTDEVGNELFRVTADGDAVKVAGASIAAQTADVQAALDGAASPSAENVFATMADAGGSGIPQGGPLTEDLDTGGFSIIGPPGAAGLPGTQWLLAGGAGDAGTDPGGSLTLQAGSGEGSGGGAQLSGGGGTVTGGQIQVYGGGTDNASGGSILLNGAVEAVGGGDVVILAGGAAAGLAGGPVVLQGGGGDDGNDVGATITVGGGDGSGNPGLIIVTGLPTSDPGVAGALYTTAGALMVSTGA